MRDSKSILLLIVSMLLIVASLFLLWTWGYNKGQQKSGGNVPLISDSTTVKLLSVDSLNDLYNDAMNNLNSLDLVISRADSVKLDIGFKLEEMNRLRDEITTLLANPSNPDGLRVAQQKILELQKRVEDLRRQNNAIQKENKRLAELLRQLAAISYPSDPVIVNQNNTVDPTTDSTQIIDAPLPSNTEVVGLMTFSQPNLTAFSEESGVSETTTAANALRMAGSFQIQNNLAQDASGEIMVVILQPDGKVLKSNSSWDTGIFESEEGRKIYSCKVKFNCYRGESRTLNFEVPAEGLSAGEYQMSLYQNGKKIASASKTLQ
jgi:hypothetical protein